MNIAQDVANLGMAAGVSQMEIDQLRDQLYQNKIFMNMCIHDCWNPTTSIKVGLEATQENLRSVLHFCEDQKKFDKKCEEVLEKMKKPINND